MVLIAKTFPIGILILATTKAGAMAAWICFLGAPLPAIFPGGLLLGILAHGGAEMLNSRSRRS